ncbi:MFS transporter [Paraburkholderia sp. BL17N1]|uniref:MFS transporter n=1 Tax=Paraburkholderia sp. BL17N1 TaxID=1938798 RepID=UPI000EAD16E5|nr:MFS transporter [Paraburkholderia sp. BL17N1]RKR36169.1 sugar phosphate permease [Paraburkholderia sp. BL17N1]
MFSFNDKWRAWVVVALLFLFMVINYADKAVIGLVAVSVMHDLSLTPRQFGLVGSSFFLLYSVSGIVFGFVANRVKTQWILVFLAATWAIVQFPMVGSVSLPMLITCRILLGVGEGPAYPIALHACYKWFDDRERGVPNAIIAQGPFVGMMLAGPILTFFIVRYGWHSAFLALGVIGIVWIVLWLLLGKEGTVDADGATQKEDHQETVPYGTLLTDPTVVGNFILWFAAFAVVALCFTWIPAYLRLGLGYSATTTGWLFSMIVTAQIPVAIALSWVSKKLLASGVSSRLARGVLAGGPIVMAGAIFWSIGSIGSPGAKVACLAAGSAMIQLIGWLGPLMLGEIVPTRQRGALLGIHNSVGTVAGLVAPAVMGLVINDALSPAAGFEQGFELLGALLVLSGLIGLYLVNPEKSRMRFFRLIQTSESPQPANTGISKRMSHDGGLINQSKE